MSLSQNSPLSEFRNYGPREVVGSDRPWQECWRDPEIFARLDANIKPEGKRRGMKPNTHKRLKNVPCLFCEGPTQGAGHGSRWCPACQRMFTPGSKRTIMRFHAQEIAGRAVAMLKEGKTPQFVQRELHIDRCMLFRIRRKAGLA